MVQGYPSYLQSLEAEFVNRKQYIIGHYTISHIAISESRGVGLPLCQSLEAEFVNRKQ